MTLSAQQSGFAALPRRRLVLLTGPIGAGKSSVARVLAQRLSARGGTAALADLDDVAFAQRGELDLAEFWRRAGVAHSALVRSWFESGAETVIAHGPFFESQSYGLLFSAKPPDARLDHILLKVSFDVALERVTNDPDRGPSAASKDPVFLLGTHEAFREVEHTVPPFDYQIDTSEVTVADVAERLVAFLCDDHLTDKSPT